VERRGVEFDPLRAWTGGGDNLPLKRRARKAVPAINKTA